MSVIKDNSPMVNGLSCTFFKNPSTPSSNFNGLSGQFFARSSSTVKIGNSRINGISHNLLSNCSATPQLNNSQKTSAISTSNSEACDITPVAPLAGSGSTDLPSVSCASSLFSSAFNCVYAALVSFFKHQNNQRKPDDYISKSNTPDFSSSPLDFLYQVEESDKAHYPIYVSPPTLAFKSMAYQALNSQTLSLTNDGNESISFELHSNITCNHTPYNPDTYTYYSASTSDQAEIKFSERLITINPGERKTIIINLVKHTFYQQKYTIYSGNIHFKPIDSRHSDIFIPYNGVIENEEVLSNGLISYDEVQEVETENYHNQESRSTEDYHYAQKTIYPQMFELGEAVIDFGDFADFNSNSNSMLSLYRYENYSQNEHYTCLSISGILDHVYIGTGQDAGIPLQSDQKTSLEVSNVYRQEYWGTVPALTTIQMMYNIGILLLIHLKYFDLL